MGQHFDIIEIYRRHRYHCAFPGPTATRCCSCLYLMVFISLSCGRQCRLETICEVIRPPDIKLRYPATSRLLTRLRNLGGNGAPMDVNNACANSASGHVTSASCRRATIFSFVCRCDPSLALFPDCQPSSRD